MQTRLSPHFTPSPGTSWFIILSVTRSQAIRDTRIGTWANISLCAAIEHLLHSMHGVLNLILERRDSMIQRYYWMIIGNLNQNFKNRMWKESKQNKGTVLNPLCITIFMYTWIDCKTKVVEMKLNRLFQKKIFRGKRICRYLCKYAMFHEIISWISFRRWEILILCPPPKKKACWRLVGCLLWK